MNKLKNIFHTVGQIVLWFLYPDTYACVLVQRAYAACPEEHRPGLLQDIAACDNVRQLESVVDRFEFARSQEFPSWSTLPALHIWCRNPHCKVCR